MYQKQAARKLNGQPMPNEELWIEISKVYKTAENKPCVFENYISNNIDLLKRSIIFVETKEYGERILNIIHQYTKSYKTYYAEDDSKFLTMFSNKEIETLVTCHKISQGIDIKDLRTVFLFSSARSKLETIQRIDRCLRINQKEPNNRQIVIDFIRNDKDEENENNSDIERMNWLKNISCIKRGDKIEY